MKAKVLLKTRKLSKTYRLGKDKLDAVKDFDLEIYEGQTIGLVGESGSGKSTLGRMLLKLLEPSSGDIFFEDHDIGQLKGQALKEYRKQAQIIFQDPYASLNPRMDVESIITEALDIHQLLQDPKERELFVKELLDTCGLQESCLQRYPHEFSGGQRQRIGIARALSLKPRFIVCDEPVSALDVSIQAQILNLLKKLQAGQGLTYLFISHDLSVVKHMADWVVVMYQGHFIEKAPTSRLYKDPKHPYTQLLLASIPLADPSQKLRTLPASEKLKTKVTGCPFAQRCPHATSLCREENPSIKVFEEGHEVACHFC